MTKSKYLVRIAEPRDIQPIIEMCRSVYSDSPPWTEEQLKGHQQIFPEGQLIVEDLVAKSIVGYAASLIVNWDDYDWTTSWRDFTAGGTFTNHDPLNGRTLYGAEIMVHPKYQGSGIGSRLYVARENLVRSKKLLRIRAGARLRGYGLHAPKMSAEEYVTAVIKKKMRDPTLSFQLKRGFKVLRVIPGYLRFDSESLGYAAVIEWMNMDIATEKDLRHFRASSFHQTDS